MLMKRLFVVTVFALAFSLVASPQGVQPPAAQPPAGIDMQGVQNILTKRSKEIDARDVEIEILTAQRDFYKARATELESEVAKLKTKSQ